MLPRNIDYPVDQIRKWIAIGWTQQRIADHLNPLDPRITAKAIYKVCRKHGIKCQRTGPRSGEGHPEWKGGRTTHKHGYVRVYCPEHPSCVQKNERRAAKANGGYYPKNRYVWEHRLVMEKKIGRYLHPKEVVHHLNGIKSDNRPDNLVLFSSNAEHLAVDLAGKCPKWSKRGAARIQAGVQKWRATRRLLREQREREMQQNSHRLSA